MHSWRRACNKQPPQLGFADGTSKHSWNVTDFCKQALSAGWQAICELEKDHQRDCCPDSARLLQAAYCTREGAEGS